MGLNALLLSAGPGERLRPLTLFLPKCLLPATSEGTMLKYWIKLLTEAGVDKIFVNVYWLKDKIMKYIDEMENCYFDKVVIYEEFRLEPTGEVIDTLAGELGNNFLIINSDTYINENQVRYFLANANVSEGYPICLGVSKHEDVSGKSLVEVEEGIVKSFIEKPGPQIGFSYAGILLMDIMATQKRVCSLFCEKELTRHIIPIFNGQMTAIDVGEVIDIGSSVEEYLYASQEILRRQLNHG